jgi:formate dehydrogenase subunit delta
METRDMVRMANQMAVFFKPYGEVEGSKELAAHINNFWEPRMRAKFFEYLETLENDLDPLVMEAAKFVRKPTNHAANQSHLPKHGEES